ncbi:AbrB family transcriptional regulator [Xinfangfangia pollutisoli]|uniref:AbrB family transcriptional regulator n=1 Tax=Xinfangfangia pollutisoli TaxID=2865960 RepID=UPI001CD3CFC4|nr:AbrB family transcriptional regulator [Xinfangfangia pollutisoli]
MRARLGLFMAVGTAGGWLFQYIGSPLPWMIGPLVVTAILCLSGLLAVQVPNRIRPFGQVIVATQIGLTFSPATMEKLVSLAPVIVVTATSTLICILTISFAFARWSGMSPAQSFLASVPTSPVEAAAMADEKGIDPMPVIFSQTLRLSAVVLVLPVAMFALEGWPASRAMPYADTPFVLQNVLILAVCGFVSMRVFRMLRVPNPNFLGPLTVAAALAASGHAPGPYPGFILALAQVVLGCWLGSTFRREILARAGRLVLTSTASILTMLALCSAMAAGIAWASGLDWRLLVLGAAPGGVTEMALTAKFLHQDATIVTAFHLTRIFIFMPNIPWIVALIIRLERRCGAPKGSDPQ